MVLFIFAISMISIFVLFFSFLAHALGHYDCFDWFNWAGWGGLTVVAFMVIGKGIIKAVKATAVILLEKYTQNKKTPPEAASIVYPERRNFLEYSLNFSLIAVSGSLTSHGLSEALEPRVKTVDIELENIPADLNGFRIVQITDLHISIGVQIHRSWVQSVVDQVNELSPDLIAFTGDIADGRFREIRYDAQPLASLNSKYGNFFVTGNHEYWHGVDEIIQGMKELGFVVLTNEHRLIRKGLATLMIGGVADYSAPEVSKYDSSPVKAMGNPGRADIKILLAHQPRSVYEAAGAGFDLQLSGHTHGGQCFIGAWLRSFVQPYQSGLYRYKNTQLYVSNGTGYWGPPLRFGAPSEITLLRLMRKRGRPDYIREC